MHCILYNIILHPLIWRWIFHFADDDLCRQYSGNINPKMYARINLVSKMGTCSAKEQSLDGGDYLCCKNKKQVKCDSYYPSTPKQMVTTTSKPVNLIQ